MQRFCIDTGHAKKRSMKQIIPAFLLLFIFSGCDKQHFGSELMGKWKLTESRNDPGDGSSKWEPADPLHPEYVEFFPGGIVKFSPQKENDPNRYRVTGDSTLVFVRNGNRIQYVYRISGSTLELKPPCFEPCGLRYKAVDKKSK